MEKLAGDLVLGLKFVKLEILSTSFIDFLYDELGELRSRSLGLSNLHSVHKPTRVYARVYTQGVRGCVLKCYQCAIR